MKKTVFVKLRGDIFKREVTAENTVSAFILDKKSKKWRPISIGNLAEAEMYGREIEKPKNYE